MEKYNPKWLLEKVRESEDQEALNYINEYQLQISGAYDNYKAIKTFEDACDAIHFYPQDMSGSKDEIAYKKLKIIAGALNGLWEADLNNHYQDKWFPVFSLSSMFKFSRSLCFHTSTLTLVGSRLCFKSEEISNYVGTQFLGLYKDFLT